MIHVSIRELKARLSFYIAAIDEMPFVITSHGKPVAVISRYVSHESPSRISPELTDDEQRIVRLITQGATNNQIAHKLCVCTKTVEKRIQHIGEVAGVRTRVEIAVWAVRNQIV
jgi:DNA-binding NarL/FixJ family response regulator